MTMEKTPPCPFCGEAPTECAAAAGPAVYCDTCDIEMLLDDWGRRATPTPRLESLSETGGRLLDIWDKWIGGNKNSNKNAAHQMLFAATFAAQAFEDAAEINYDGAPGQLLRTFLTALADFNSHDLDHLRACNRPEHESDRLLAQTEPAARLCEDQTFKGEYHFERAAERAAFFESEGDWTVTPLDASVTDRPMPEVRANVDTARAALTEIAAISGGPIRRIALDALEKMETD